MNNPVFRVVVMFEVPGIKDADCEEASDIVHELTKLTCDIARDGLDSTDKDVHVFTADAYIGTEV